MRIRQVKPAFWGDDRLAALPERTRLFYIGLWMLADDAGWLRWNPAEVSRDLYGYESRRAREKRVATMFDELVEARRVVLHPCGHAEVPKLAEHQRLSGVTKQVRTVEREHQACLAASRTSPHIPARNVKVRNGKERNGTDARAPEEGAGESEFTKKVGGNVPQDLVGSRRVA